MPGNTEVPSPPRTGPVTVHRYDRENFPLEKLAPPLVDFFTRHYPAYFPSIRRREDVQDFADIPGRLAEGRTYFVAQDTRQRIVGLLRSQLILIPATFDSPWSCAHLLEWILSEPKGTGTGSHLHRAFEEHSLAILAVADEMRLRAVQVLQVYPHNPAIHTFRHWGYRETTPDQTADTSVVMQKTITRPTAT